MDYPDLPHQLPQEVIDIIIDDDPYDQAMQKTFALVSKAFLLRSRTHFFRVVSFHGDDGECRALQARFSKILNVNPDIASYIREVYIEEYGSSETLSEDDGERTSWILEEETFQEILLVLAQNQITDLKLDIDFRLEWTSFPAGLQHALTEILTTPSLRTLEVSNIKILPVTCCTRFSGLEHLRISGVILAESEEHQQREAVTVSISSLDLTGLRGRSAQLFRSMLGLGTTDNSLALVERLRISNCDPEFMREVIWAARKSLRRLTLTTRNIGKDTDVDLIHLSELESLNWLVVKAFYRENFEAGVFGILEAGGPNKELSSIHITLFQASYRWWSDYFLRQDTWSFWARLTIILNQFSSVMDLVIELSMYRDGGPVEEHRTALERSVRDSLSSGGGNFANVNRVLLVRISEL